MTSWPAIRTDPEASRGRELAILAVCALGMLIGSVVVGGLLVLLGSLANTVFGTSIVSTSLGDIGILVMYSPIASWIGLLVGVPAAFMALRQGIAGWAVAVIAGLAVGVGLAVSGVISALGLTLPIGGILAGLFWLSGRLFFSNAFCSRVS